MSSRDLIVALVGPEEAAEIQQRLMRARMLDALQFCADPHAEADGTCGRCGGPIAQGERVYFPNNPYVSEGYPSVVWHRACYYVTSSQLHEARLAKSRHEKRLAREREAADPRQVGLFDVRIR